MNRLNEHLEKELKFLLSQNSYQRLKHSLRPYQRSTGWQKNLYFDTPTLDLQKKGSSLRLRQKPKTQKSELTLKIKEGGRKSRLQHMQTVREISLPLSPQQALRMIQNPTEFIAKTKLASLVDFPLLEYKGTLSTYRSVILYQGEMLELDRSLYLSQVDYELEIETQDALKTMRVVRKLFQDHSVSPLNRSRPSLSKIQRFYRALLAQTR